MPVLAAFRTVYKPQLAASRADRPPKAADGGDESSDDDIIEIVSRTALQQSARKRPREGEEEDDGIQSKEERELQKEDKIRKARRALLYGEAVEETKPDVKLKASPSTKSFAERLAAMKAMAAAAQESNANTRNKIMLARATVAQEAAAAENAAAAAAAAAAASSTAAALPAPVASPRGASAIDGTSTVLVQLRHVGGDEGIFPATCVRMPVGTALRKLLKRLIKSLRKNGSLPESAEVSDYGLRYDGAAVNTERGLLALDRDAIADWLADADGQGDPACILDVVVQAVASSSDDSCADDASADAPVPASAPAPAPVSAPGSVSAPAPAPAAAPSPAAKASPPPEPQGAARPASPSLGAHPADIPTAVLVKFRSGVGDDSEFPNIDCRLSADLSLGKQLSRLLKRMPGRRMNARQAAKVFLRCNGQEVDLEGTLKDATMDELQQWVAEGCDGVACIFDVHFRS